METSREAPDSRSLHDDRVFARAVEASIWGMPAVSMAAIRQSLPRDLDATYGDIIYFSDVLQPRHEFLTANNQTPYVLTFLNLKDGPVVVDVPPASAEVMLFGSAIDSWQVPLVDLGPAGEDAGRGGRYLFLPPDYAGDVPDGYLVVPSPTTYVHIALRPITTAQGTLSDAVAYAQRLKTYPLAQAATPPVNRYIDGFPRVWQTLPTFDVGFLALLAQVLTEEPAQPKDAAMLGMLASIGIANGVPFAPDEARAALLTEAVQAGAAAMQDYFINQAFASHWPGLHWLATKRDPNYGYSFYGDGVLDYDRRAGGFTYWATWAPKRLSEPGTLPASTYFKAFRDRDGALFRGERTYRLRVPGDVPTRDFWSVVVYELATNAFIHNAQERVGLSSYDKERLQVDADGGVEVYIGPAAPEGKAANWIPTAGKDFWLIFRCYGPQPALFDQSWTFNDVEAVK